MNKWLQKLESYLEQCISLQEFPGCCIGVRLREKIILRIARGNSSVEPQHNPVTETTIYDVASLTKPLITGTLINLAFQSNDLNPETTLGQIYGECPSDKSAITVSDLLTHQSGFLDWYPLFSSGSSIEEYRNILFELQLKYQPRSDVVYSCPGYIILADILQQLHNDTFVNIVGHLVFESLDLKDIYLGEALDLKRVAATEKDSVTEHNFISELNMECDRLRTGIVHGQTHDSNSWFAGGSAGNAGLFTTIDEAFKLLDQYTSRSSLLNEKTIADSLVNHTQFHDQHRSYGWQLASSSDCSAGKNISPDSFGHTGFTGTSIWHDPKRDISIAIFTNRIHPANRENNMNIHRRKIHDLLISHLISGGIVKR